MPVIKIDFTDAGDNPQDFTKVPEGMHPAVLTKVELKAPSADPQKRMFEFTFKFPKHEGRELKLFNMVNQKDKNTYLKHTLVALGVNVTKGVNAVDTDAIIGKTVTAKVIHEERKVTEGEHAGKTFTDDKIKLVFPPDGTPSGGSAGGALDLTGGTGASANLADIPF